MTRATRFLLGLGLWPRSARRTRGATRDTKNPAASCYRDVRPLRANELVHGYFTSFAKRAAASFSSVFSACRSRNSRRAAQPRHGQPSPSHRESLEPIKLSSCVLSVCPLASTAFASRADAWSSRWPRPATAPSGASCGIRKQAVGSWEDFADGVCGIGQPRCRERICSRFRWEKPRPKRAVRSAASAQSTLHRSRLAPDLSVHV